VNTETYILPLRATKGRQYECAECYQRVIFRKGEVRTPHFAHLTPTTKCTYYNPTPGESDNHKHAKLLLQKWITEKKPINLCWTCQTQTKWGACGVGVDESIVYKDGDTVVLEYRDPDKQYVADVAIMNGGELRYIIEVVHSHRTTTTCRPEPWFEVEASEVDEQMQFGEDTNIVVENCRLKNPKFCSNCKVKSEHWVNNIPVLTRKYGSERQWRQDKPCIGCDQMRYSPEWIANRPRQVCKLCLGNEPTRVREALSARV